MNDIRFASMSNLIVASEFPETAVWITFATPKVSVPIIRIYLMGIYSSLGLAYRIHL